MELHLNTQRQYIVADLLWNAQTMFEVDAILTVYGRDATLVYNLMMAEHVDGEVDEMTEFPEVLEILDSLK